MVAAITRDMLVSSVQQMQELRQHTSVCKVAALAANVHFLQCNDIQRLQSVLTLELSYNCLQLVAPLDIKLRACAVYYTAWAWWTRISAAPLPNRCLSIRQYAAKPLRQALEAPVTGAVSDQAGAGACGSHTTAAHQAGAALDLLALAYSWSSPGFALTAL